MRRKKTKWRGLLLAALMLLWVCGIGALASGASSDNSLSSLGITTEGATVSPEFAYGTTEYDVTVPGGTTRLELDPVTSHPNAWIVGITGQDIGENGEATVTITVSAENGSQYPYYLHVKTDPTTSAPATEQQTEPPTEPETEPEPETEDPRYVRVERSSLEEADHAIKSLKEEVVDYRDRMNLLTMILYGMIGLCVVLLFVVINLLLKRRDMKSELKEYRSYGYTGDAADGTQDQDAGYAGYGYPDENGGYPEEGYPAGNGGYADSGISSGSGAYGEPGFQNADGGYGGAGFQDGNGSYGEPDLQSADSDYGESGIGGEDRVAGAGYPGGGAAGAEDGWDDSDGGFLTEADSGRTKAAGRLRREKKTKAVKDDPDTVPKPSKARKKTRKMPEYDAAEPEHQYEPPKKKTQEKVGIDMIDL